MPNNIEPIPFLVGADFVERRNVAWRIEMGQPDKHNPLIEPHMPWDDGETFMHGTVLRDPIDGLWKAWSTAAPKGTFDRRLVYYQSNDGIDWQRPEIDIHGFGEYERTNILLDFDSGGTSIYANVFVDPDTSSEHRYQMYILRRPEEPDYQQSKGVVAGFHNQHGGEVGTRGVYRYYSSDGICWKPEVGPVLINDPNPLATNGTADGYYIYRDDNNKYVIYHKTLIPSPPGSMIPYELGAGKSRVLVRRTSEDGIHWSAHEPCLTPDWRDPADTQFMEMSVTPMAGGYVGIVTVYRTSNQTLEFQLAASRDGRYWWRPDRRPCIVQPPLGDYGGGMMWGSHQLIEDGDNLHYYYGAMQGLHGDMLSTEELELAQGTDSQFKMLAPLGGESFTRISGELYDHGAMCRATWMKGRLWALATAAGGDMEGFATTTETMCQGQAVEINTRTISDGQVLAELVDSNGNVPTGFNKENSDGVTSDTSRIRMTWRGQSKSPSDGLRVRFYIKQAFIYGFQFVDAG